MGRHFTHLHCGHTYPEYLRVGTDSWAVEPVRGRAESLQGACGACTHTPTTLVFRVHTKALTAVGYHGSTLVDAD
ncbi:hypothetical protein DPMN_164051 [Dreissena polymorpha]|uniref:Uncharacterized protein n=1 Tax=Dreissena polymorpha TaxID=45954 RepID=A0A9D4EXT3_DREPO|nr:hypothetical protein DPMN_164051 [Dreissena polymorpha]